MDPDDFMRSTNGSAYTNREERTGPPLDYIGEKTRKATESAHEVIKGIEACVPDDLPLPAGYKEHTPFKAKEALLLSPAHYGFHNAVIAFLALNNMLGAAQSLEDVKRLARMDTEEFCKWLDFVEREGSVLG